MENLLRKVSDRLGGAANIGRPLRSDVDLVKAVSVGIKPRALTQLLKYGITAKELNWLVIPEKTLRTRKAKKQRLSMGESEKAARLARIQALAEDTFHDREKANRWLRKELRLLEGRTPLDVSQTEPGAKLVETLLANITWGAPA
jgi:putative toxin-antitoxin system antitoxin component (TIGR02293 family)